MLKIDLVVLYQPRFATVEKPQNATPKNLLIPFSNLYWGT